MVKFDTHKAERKNTWLRLAFTGPAGSGKTLTSLKIATYMANKMGTRAALIDTEGNSSELYGNKYDFEVLPFEENMPPDIYAEAIVQLSLEFNPIIIDSLTHAWIKSLEMVDNIADQKFKGNRWAAWSIVTPKVNALVDTILQTPVHIIGTMRVKTEWATEKDERTGKSKPVKIGLAPVQREGMDYEFTIVGEMNESAVTFTKWRDCPIDNKVIHEPGEEVAEVIWDWLHEGEAEPRQWTKYQLMKYGEIVYGISPKEIGLALEKAKLEFDPEKWDEMKEALANYG